MTEAQEQSYNPILTAMPSLMIAPDARAGGMGDVGVATMPDIYSQHWNAAKYPFVSPLSGVSFSYTPWLSKLVGDIYMLHLCGYWKFGSDKMNAVSSSLRYFSLGELDIFDIGGEFLQSERPHEFAFDIAYSRKLTERLSGAVTLRYIHADYSAGSDETTPGNAFAADIAGYSESYFFVDRSELLLGLGFNLSNIGTKISYDGGNSSMFLPANMRVGAYLGYPLDAKNTIGFSMDLNKLLVPTPQLATDDESDEERLDRINKYNNISPIAAVFKSLGDAPGGFKEEMQEIVYSFGVEYVYDNQFSIRTGYSHENEYKGNHRYFTFGAGIRIKTFQIDAAYLVATSQSNPLDQTLRLSLGFNIDDLRNLLH